MKRAAFVTGGASGIGQAIGVQVDVSDRSQVDKAVAAARGEFGPIGIPSDGNGCRLLPDAADGRGGQAS